MRKSAVQKIRFLTWVIILFVCILIGRLYQIQVLEGEKYRAEAENQYVHTVRELYKRGSIFLQTKDGEKVSAATMQTGYLLAIDPTRITDVEATYSALNAILPIDKEDFALRANKKEKTYQEINRQVSTADADKIEVLKLKGIGLYRNQWRYYPGNSLAARTIGFIGYQENELVGKYGLERYYEDTLVRDEERLFVNFFAEIFSNFSTVVFDKKDDEQGDIITSIEPTVARTLDKTLEAVNEKYQSTLTGGIIMDPNTGEVYALSIAPSFDLNNKSEVDIATFSNPLVENVYEMGSIIKALTMASGLDSGAVTPSSTYYDAGYIDLDDYTIKNFDGRGRGTVSMQEVLNQSLNTGVAHVVKTMGKDTFRDYFTKLKLGTETGIDLPSEGHGLVENLKSPRDVEYATASFGQGIALTPIATTRALATLANGGVLITPHIVQRTLHLNGKEHEVGFPPGEQVFSKETSEEITRMLVTVVDKALKHGTVAMEHYSIAAKTGTAQISDPETKKYYDDRYLHSFFGYFPAYDPKFLIFLYTVEPKGVSYASETLTDPFMDLTHFLINYYSIPPDR